MILPVVKYGTPILRQKGARIDAVTPTIKKLIADMLETMYAHKGIGLAAQQVGLALQLTVLDVRGVTDRPSSLELNAQSADVHAFMPLALLNPEVKPVGKPLSGPEGCLSFPEIFSEIRCPPGVGCRANIAADDVHTLHRSTPHSDNVRGIGIKDGIASQGGKPLQILTAKTHLGRSY